MRVEQFLDLGEASARDIFRDISAPIFDLLVIQTNHYASQKNFSFVYTKHYNSCMGGVDLVGRALSDLRPVIQGKNNAGHSVSTP